MDEHGREFTSAGMANALKRSLSSSLMLSIAAASMSLAKSPELNARPLYRNLMDHPPIVQMPPKRKPTLLILQCFLRKIFPWFQHLSA